MDRRSIRNGTVPDQSLEPRSSLAPWPAPPGRAAGPGVATGAVAPSLPRVSSAAADYYRRVCKPLFTKVGQSGPPTLGRKIRRPRPTSSVPSAGNPSIGARTSKSRPAARISLISSRAAAASIRKGSDDPEPVRALHRLPAWTSSYFGPGCVSARASPRSLKRTSESSTRFAPAAHQGTAVPAFPFVVRRMPCANKLSWKPMLPAPFAT